MCKNAVDSNDGILVNASFHRMLNNSFTHSPARFIGVDMSKNLNHKKPFLTVLNFYKNYTVLH